MNIFISARIIVYYNLLKILIIIIAIIIKISEKL
uniref:Uncharacterized protein n=1 Tax=viral metagenome TaxID=1070528 RepID=A0A6C0H814_9ZZZZ